MSARKLDGCFDAFASGTREKYLLQPAAGASAKFFSQLSRELGNVALQHGRTTSIQFVAQRFHDCGVIMAGVMDAVSGKKIENVAPISGEKLRSGTTLVSNIHLQDLEQLHPLRIYVIHIERVESGQGGCMCQVESFL